MGSWWLYSKADTAAVDDKASGTLVKIPTNREDIAFSDTSIDLRSKRTVMKVLRFVVDYENHSEVWEPFKDKPFVSLLQTHFKVSPQVVDLFLSLVLSPYAVRDTSTSFALARIARHLRSIGRLGPGFSSVVPKWGGLSEVSQVSCRAGAVGGAVYVLDNSLVSAITSGDRTTIKLKSGDEVRAKWLIGSSQDIPQTQPPNTSPTSSRAIAIVGSKLATLFSHQADGAPSPVGSVVIFPANSLRLADSDADAFVHLIIHTSDTGECPKDQCKFLPNSSFQPSHDDQTLLNTYLHFPNSIDEKVSDNLICAAMPPLLSPKLHHVIWFANSFLSRCNLRIDLPYSTRRS